VDGVGVGGDGLRVAIDHDRLEAFVAQRERRVTAAVVELDALPDAVRAAPEDDDFVLRRRVGFALLLERAVEVRRERLELGGTRVIIFAAGRPSWVTALSSDGPLLAPLHTPPNRH